MGLVVIGYGVRNYRLVALRLRVRVIGGIVL